MARAAAGRPPRRQCGDARRRGAAPAPAARVGRRSRAHRRLACRADRDASRLAAAHAGDAARPHEAARDGIMIERASMGRWPYALLILLCLGLYLPGIAALPVLDRDEARFAQATRQMLESGDFLRIRFQDEARNKKPVGIYWLEAASVAALSDAESTAIWPYRLPSLLGAVVAVLLTFALGSALLGREAALLGAALLASALGLVAEAHLAKTDAVLLAAAARARSGAGLSCFGALKVSASWSRDPSRRC